jgi:hypothetical protein
LSRAQGSSVIFFNEPTLNPERPICLSDNFVEFYYTIVVKRWPSPAYELKSDSAAVADTLGWMLVEQGDTARGLELLQEAVAAAPDVHEIRYHLAHDPALFLRTSECC